jgi:hypothetical protein
MFPKLVTPEHKVSQLLCSQTRHVQAGGAAQLRKRGCDMVLASLTWPFARFKVSMDQRFPNFYSSRPP